MFLQEINVIFNKINIFLCKLGIFSSNLKNYENDKLNTYIINKTKKIFIEKDCENLKINQIRALHFSWFIKKNNFHKVLDFGGGAGYHYFLTKNFLENKYNLDWNVVENDTMVNLCIKKINIKKLFYFNNLLKVKKKIDIIFSSCAINYCQCPKKILNDLFNFPCKYYYFTRTHLSEKNDIEFDQFSMLSENGPGKLFIKKDEIVKVRNKILAKNNFEKIIKKHCEILFSFKDEEKSLSYKENVNSYTYILKKNKKFIKSTQYN
jgi:putative methyltransferase (TIGR04325 family)